MIEKCDIDSLLTNRITECRTLDYKLSLPNTQEQDKIRFLADVCAFANTAGGDLIYGVRESETEPGFPDELLGLAEIETDSEIRRLDQMISTGIVPRIPRIRIKHIDGFEQGPIILVRVPKSFTGPHAVIRDEWMRYYARSSNRNTPMDVQQVYTAHSATYGLIDSIKRFRTERLSSILTDDTPVPLKDAPKLVLHVLPAFAFDESARVDVLGDADQFLGNLRPMGSAGTHLRYNLDGVLVKSQFSSGSDYSNSYVQLFRSGSIETVYVLDSVDRNADNKIAGLAIENLVLSSSLDYLDFLKNIGVEPPINVAVSLLGIAGCTLRNDSRGFSHSNEVFDRDMLKFPEVTLDHHPGDEIDLFIKPILDCIWQACGYEKSPYYDRNGRHNDRNGRHRSR